MQKGSIRVSGKWWYLKIREDVVKGGQHIKNAIVYHKLLPTEQYPKNGDAVPPAVQLMADEIAGRVHLKGKNPHSLPLSIDSFRSFLESYLAAGIGANGQSVRKVTLKSMKRDFNVVKTFIPDMPLRSVRTPHINQIFRDLIQADGDDLRATSAYRNVRNFLSGAFRDAVGRGLAEFNPVRESMVLEGTDADTHAYALAEVKRIMDAIKLEKVGNEDDWKHTMRAAFMVAFFTGLRQEEIKGLKWTDYDEKNQLLHVRRTVVNHQIVEDTKTKSSKAPVVVVKTVAKVLADHKKRNSGDGFIFHKATSSQAPIIFEHIMREKVQPACKEAGLKFPIHMHAFRRGLDSWMKDAGIDLSLRTDIMRHSPRNVTDKHYGRASVKQMRAVLRRIEAAYNKTK